VVVLGVSILSAIACPAVAASATASERDMDAHARLTPDLLWQMQTVAPDEPVPFTVVLQEQADASRLRIAARRVALSAGRTEARGYATGVLKEIAARSQTAVLDALAREKSAGRVRSYRSLWIANVVAGWATSDVITALADLPGVARVVWDPPVSEDSQRDEYVAPEGLRAVPPPGERDPEIGWNLEMIGAPEAWSQGYRGQEIVVGLIDSGVDYTHPDLVNRMWTNEDEIPWNGEDDDFNGFVDDTLGWDFPCDDNDPMGSGPTDHGTRAAGLVAGDGTGGIATGVAPGARIMALKASGGSWSDVFSAIQYACDNNADVISMSLTQKWHGEPKPDYAVWRQITDNELAVGICHANSIGNEGDNQETDPIPFNISTPGSSPSPWVTPDQYIVGGVSAVTAVGSIDSLMCLADYSSRGPFAWEDIAAYWPEYPHEMPVEYQDYPYTAGSLGLIKPDLLAPGRSVLSTMQGGGYLSFSGTSSACPHVAGVMAILLQADPEITPAQVAMAMQLGAVDLGPAGKDNDYGAGVVDIPGALAVVDSLDTLAFLSGIVTDATTGDSLPGAAATLLETANADTTNSQGIYELITAAGLFALEVRCFGYDIDTLEILIAPGEIRIQDFALEPWATGTVSGLVFDEEGGEPIAGAIVGIPGTPIPADTTGLDGIYSFDEFPADTSLIVRAIHFGHLWMDSLVTVGESQLVEIDFEMLHGVADDFEVDQGWAAGDSSDTALQGLWVRCDPNGIVDHEIPVQPEDDHTEDPGIFCYVTGNGVPGSGEYQNDVDGGWTTLTSPIFDGSWFYEPLLTFAWWYSNDTGLFVDDTLRVEISNDAGQSWVTILVTDLSNHAWQVLPVFLSSVAELTDSMCVRVIASDTGNASSVEVAIDDFEVTGAAYSPVGEDCSGWKLSFLGPRPNPFRSGSSLTFTLARPSRVELEIFDTEGRRVRTLVKAELEPGLHEINWNATDNAGRPCAAGVYFSRFSAQGTERTKRLILVR
jgi:serine protease AprX